MGGLAIGASGFCPSNFFAICSRRRMASAALPFVVNVPAPTARW